MLSRLKVFNEKNEWRYFWRPPWRSGAAINTEIMPIAMLRLQHAKPAMHTSLHFRDLHAPTPLSLRFHFDAFPSLLHFRCVRPSRFARPSRRRVDKRQRQREREPNYQNVQQFAYRMRCAISAVFRRLQIFDSLIKCNRNETCRAHRSYQYQHTDTHDVALLLVVPVAIWTAVERDGRFGPWICRVGGLVYFWFGSENNCVIY